MAESRAVRNLHIDITNASHQLRYARKAMADDYPGGPTPRQLMHWFDRRNQLLDRWQELTAQPEETAQ